MRFRLPRLQFSLRTLVIVVVIVAALASWHGSRYARYKARVAALVDLKEAGIFLYPWVPDDRFLPSDLPFKSNPDQRELSWLEHWDQYWFGSEAIKHYPLLRLSATKYLDSLRENKVPDRLTQLALFAEVQTVQIEPRSKYGYEGSRIDEELEARPLPPELLQQLARFPELSFFVHHGHGAIDDEWVKAMPNSSPLQTLYATELPLTPDGMRSLLNKAPDLRCIKINQHALSAETVSELNRRPFWNEANPFARLEHALMFGSAEHLQIQILDPRTNPGKPLEPSLRDLQKAYRLTFNDEPGAALPDVAPVLELAGYQVPFLEFRHTARLRIQDFPKLSTAFFYQCRDVQISNCPQLKECTLTYCDEIRLAQLPMLEELRLNFTGTAEVANCTKVKEILFDRDMKYQPSNLTLTKLTALQKLHFRGDTLALTDLPSLRTLKLVDPTPEQLRELTKLPALENLTLAFWQRPASLPPGTLAALREIKSLRALRFEGFSPFEKTAGAALREELRELPQLNVLWVEKISELLVKAENLAPSFVLPAHLTVLIESETSSPEPSWDELRKQHPEILYLNRSHFKSTGNPYIQSTARTIELEELAEALEDGNNTPSAKP